MEISSSLVEPQNEFILIHLPQLKIDSKITDVALNLLPAQLQKTLKLQKINAVDLLVFSGDTCNIANKNNFQKARELILELQNVASCNSVVTVPGDIDLNRTNIDGLVTKRIRDQSVEKISKAHLNSIAKNQEMFNSFLNFQPEKGIFLGMFPPTNIYKFEKQSTSINLITIDTSFFSLGTVDDKGSLLVGGNKLRTFIEDKVNGSFNIVVSHHNPLWISQSQNEIIKILNGRCQLWLYGHFIENRESSDDFSLENSIYKIGPEKPAKGYQIIRLNLQNNTILVNSYIWNEYSINWSSKNSELSYFKPFKGVELPSMKTQSNGKTTQVSNEQSDKLGSRQMEEVESAIDTVILTVLPEEYQAVCNLIPNLIPAVGLINDPNLLAWKTGYINCNNYGGSYSVAIGMIGRSGTSNSALATIDAIIRWHPRYLFFVGIAGGLGDLEKGDIVLADVIYGYEYGKIEKIFQLRTNWTFNTDQGLLNSAIAYSFEDTWKKNLSNSSLQPGHPKAIIGEIASGDKVVDDPTNPFFANILDKLPRLSAVEMEGAGVGQAIEQSHAKGYSIGFMMIRGISDLPRKQKNKKELRGSQERETWKKIASNVAATFTLGWIQNGLPIKPSSLSK